MEGGELVAYDDHFKDITPEDAAFAEERELTILKQAGHISRSFLMIAQLLSEFEEKKLYKARGYETFKLWANSPNLHGIGYRTARNLIRIYREAVPIFARHDKMDLLPLIQTSKMQALLPILGDEDAEDKFIEAAYQIKDKTIKDSYAIIDEIRGKKNKYDESMPTVFSAQVQYGESYHKVRITAIGEDDIYDCGTLNIKARDWHRWEERFGRFVEVK
jgi:hypothetical protein